MKHTFHRCDDPGCVTCKYNILYCEVCECYEHTLTSECPGHIVTGKEANDIYAGKLDFKNGEWIKTNNGHSNQL